MPLFNTPYMGDIKNTQGVGGEVAVNGMTPGNNAASPNVGADVTGPLSPSSQSGNQASPFGGFGANNQGGRSAVDFSAVQNPFSTTGFLDPNIRQSYTNLLDGAGGMLSQWNQSFQQAQDLPRRIDEWSRAAGPTYDDIVGKMIQTANDRAGRGIMAGTEAENLRGNLLAQLANQHRQDALQLKTQAAMQLPQIAGQGLGFLGDYLGMGRESYQEDPAAWGNIVANLIRAGFTG